MVEGAGAVAFVHGPPHVPHNTGADAATGGAARSTPGWTPQGRVTMPSMPKPAGKRCRLRP